MKKLFVIILVLFFALQVFPQKKLRVLKIEGPAGGKGKRILHLNLKHIQDILDTFNLKEGSLRVELADMSGYPYVLLAKVKKGKIKWSHKISQDQNLMVKFKKNEYLAVQEKLKGSSTRPGLRLQVRDVSTKLKVKKTNSIFSDQTIIKKQLTLGWCEITPVTLPDLAMHVKYPVRIQPGEAFKEDFVVTIENRGDAPASNVMVQVLLSGDEKIPLTPAPASATFTDDGVLPNGESVIPSLNPGEKKVLTFQKPITIPLGIAPKRYYLGVVVDPGNKIGELVEENNIFSGFILIYVPMPKNVTVDLPGTLLIVDPDKFILNVMNQDVVLSDSREWRKCRFKAYIWHFKHASWKNYFLEVNTVDKEVYLIRGGTFCRRGGQAKQLKIKVIVTGGSMTSVPSKIVLQLTDTQLKFVPKTREFTISMHGFPITHMPYWRVCTESTSVYYFKHLVWPGFFWKIDSFVKVFNRISKGTFCKEGGSALKLDLEIKTEDQ